MYKFIKAVIITGISSILYGFTLSGEFVFDDSEAIVKNSDVVGAGSLSGLLAHDFWGSDIISNLSHKSYRPVTVLTFRLNYYINGNQLQATHFKLTNLLCHIACSLLLWRTYSALFPEKNCFTDVAFLAAVLFAVHPVHVEAVSGIVGRADVLAGIFYSLAFLSYVQSTKTQAMSKVYFNLLITFACSTLSMLSKEIGITVLGVCLCYEIIYIWKANIIRVLQRLFSSLGKISMRKCEEVQKSAVIRVFFLISTCAALLILRMAVMGNSKPSFQETDNPAAFSDDFFTRVATYQYIYFLNMLLLIWPQWLCFDWSMGCVSLVQSPFDPKILCVASLYIFAVKSFQSLAQKKMNNSRKRLLVMSFAMIVIPFVPASNIFFPVGFVVAERLLYVPSAGFCLLIGFGVKKLGKKYKLAYAFYVLLLVAFSLRTWQRSHDWRTEYELFTSGLRVCPGNAKVHYNVANFAEANQQTELAIQEYREAIRLYPKYYQAMNNLANLLKVQNKFREAELYLRDAIKYKSDFAAAWMNLGIVLANTRRWQEARDAYHTALSHRHNYPDCYYNLGNLYLEMELNDQAIESWNNAISLNPKHRLAWSNLLALLDNTGQTQKALDLLPTALSALPEAHSIHFIGANILGKMGQFERAEKHFQDTIKFAGKNLQAIHFANLGVLYHRWKKYELAEKYYKKALVVNPSLKSALNNISTVKKLLNGNNIIENFEI